MDIKTILNKLEDCKKDSQRKELIKNLIHIITYPKTKKIYEQLLKINYIKTLDNLYKHKENDSFLEILTSIIQNLTPLTKTYRKKYQETLLNLIIPLKIKDEEEALKNLNYFIIATNNLDDIDNIKHKKYLIFYLFFQIVLKVKLDLTIIDLLLKLEKYMSRFQHEIIVYVLIIYSFIIKNDDTPEQMIILKKIIEFCKLDSSNETYFQYKNEDITQNIVIMLLLYTPFKQEILINLYNTDHNYFINIIQNIIIFLGNYLQENNKYNVIYNTDLININNFFEDDINAIDLDEMNYNNKDVLYNYFNNKEYFIKKYNQFIEKINLKEILILNKDEIYKGVIWTLSNIILKN